MDALASIFRRLCFVDVETTGLDPQAEAIIEVGLVFVERGVVTARRGWLAQPGRPVPPLITALTGLGDDDLRDARAWPDVAPQVRHALEGWTLVAHNATFERAFLGALLDDSAVVDSCELAALLFPELPSHSLDALLRRTGVAAGARHRALEDAEDTFLALAALVEEHLAEGDGPAPLTEARRQLGDGLTRDQAALASLLGALDAAPRSAARPRAARVPPRTDELLVERFRTWLTTPARVAIELEARDALAEVVAAARGLPAGEAPVLVALPGPRLRELGADAPAPIVPRLPVCSAALRAALAAPAADAASRLGRAYLARWLPRSPDGDVEATSGFVLKRGGDAKALLRGLTRCGCDDEGCFARRAARASGPCLLVSHELALEWHERGAPVRVVFLHAEQLPDAERRRRTRKHPVPPEAQAPGHPQHELAAALAGLAHGPVELKAHATPAWLRVREAAVALSRADAAFADLAWLLEPPAPGLELFAGPAGLTVAPLDPAGDLRARLAAGTCLVTSREGGLAWLGQPPTWAAPAPTGGRRVTWEPGPVPVEALPALARGLAESVGAPVLLVSAAPLADVAGACLAAGVHVSLDSRADAPVRLVPWAREEPLAPAAACLFYGVRELRRAVLSSPAPRVVLAAPRGLEREAVERALKGL